MGNVKYMEDVTLRNIIPKCYIGLHAYIGNHLHDHYCK